MCKWSRGNPGTTGLVAAHFSCCLKLKQSAERQDGTSGGAGARKDETLSGKAEGFVQQHAPLYGEQGLPGLLLDALFRGS